MELKIEFRFEITKILRREIAETKISQNQIGSRKSFFRNSR